MTSVISSTQLDRHDLGMGIIEIVRLILANQIKYSGLPILIKLSNWLNPSLFHHLVGKLDKSQVGCR